MKQNIIVKYTYALAAALEIGLLPACAQDGGASWSGGTSGGGGGISFAQAQPMPTITLASADYTGAKKQNKDVAWLGLSFDESSEAVASQLGLKSGEGLTVNFVAANSPAAKADFHTNDVLVDFDGQMLVHPAQLRKLIQVHSEGDTVKLTFYRAGEKQSASIKLGQTKNAQTAGNENNVYGLTSTQNYKYQYVFGGGSGNDTKARKTRGKEVTWLGVGVAESSEDEALSAQLALQAGEGLTVNYLAPDSPAAQAGFQTNDVLTELDGQMLVHPLQLRKLVEMHADGDTITVAYCRGGKKLNATVKLGKASAEKEAAEGQDDFGGIGKNLQLQLKELPGQWNNLSHAWTVSGAKTIADEEKAKREMERAMEQAKKAIQEAVHNVGTNERDLNELTRQLELLEHDHTKAVSDATVVVTKKSGSSRTIVQTDEDGTLVIEGGDRNRLTARDKNGKLLFEGNIDTAEEQAKVPKEVWERAKPMVDQITTSAPKIKSPESGSDEPKT